MILLPDAEKLVVDYLRNHSDVDTLVDGRVSTAQPSSPDYPLVIVGRLAGLAQERDWLDTPVLQIDVWADKREEAWQVMCVVRAAMTSSEISGVHTLGTVTGTEETAGPTWFPDPVTNRPRFTYDVQVYIHP